MPPKKDPKKYEREKRAAAMRDYRKRVKERDPERAARDKRKRADHIRKKRAEEGDEGKKKRAESMRKRRLQLKAMADDSDYQFWESQAWQPSKRHQVVAPLNSSESDSDFVPLAASPLHPSPVRDEPLVVENVASTQTSPSNSTGVIFPLPVPQFHALTTEVDIDPELQLTLGNYQPRCNSSTDASPIITSVVTPPVSASPHISFNLTPQTSPSPSYRHEDLLAIVNDSSEFLPLLDLASKSNYDEDSLANPVIPHEPIHPSPFPPFLTASLSAQRSGVVADPDSQFIPDLTSTAIEHPPQSSITPYTLESLDLSPMTSSSPQLQDDIVPPTLSPQQYLPTLVGVASPVMPPALLPLQPTTGTSPRNSSVINLDETVIDFCSEQSPPKKKRSLSLKKKSTTVRYRL